MFMFVSSPSQGSFVTPGLSIRIVKNSLSIEGVSYNMVACYCVFILALVVSQGLVSAVLQHCMSKQKKALSCPVQTGINVICGLVTQ